MSDKKIAILILSVITVAIINAVIGFWYLIALTIIVGITVLLMEYILGATTHIVKSMRQSLKKGRP